jgi:hypothetical protein
LDQQQQWTTEETYVLSIVTLVLLTDLTCFGTIPRPYNMPLSGADYTLAVLQRNPGCTIDVFQVATSTFMFLCDELLTVQDEAVSRLKTTLN